MNTSAQGLALIRQRQGYQLEAYAGRDGVPTIGIGHVGPEVNLGLLVGPGQAEAAFQRDVAREERAINRLVLVPLEQHEFDALASWAFTITEATFAGSELLRLLNGGADRTAVAAQLDLEPDAEEIRPRRTAEREQFKGVAFEAEIA